MKQDNENEFLYFILMFIPIIWIAILIAPYLDNGLIGLIPKFSYVMEHPFSITLCKNTPKSILVCVVIYIGCYGMYLSTKKNKRPKEEYGSASWANSKKVNDYYANKDYFYNKLFTQNVRMGLDVRRYQRNLNSLIIGGSGAGKTRFYAKPNIMQANTSFVILDPKGEILRDTGNLLKKEGYVIKVIDLIDMTKSHCYNPFHYIQDDKDILKLITNLIRNTTPKGSQANDPFWEKSETALLQALMLYLYHEAPEDEQNFTMVMEMIAAKEVHEDDDSYEDAIDILFQKLELKKPGTLAYKQYEIFKLAPGKTAMSILVSIGVRLASFNLEALASMTAYDELELEKLGERKTALFAIIPDNDSTFNFLIGMLYTQLFQMLYYQAEMVHGGQLPVPVHFMMDEFANVALPDEFDKLLATMRSKGISVSIILQNLAQLKALYKDSWESIVGNCDELYYLGGNEQSTHKFISETLGKETLDTNTFGRTTGHSGSYSTNFQQTGRELLTPDEVRLLDNSLAILIIRGEKPIIDKKYDLLNHPRIKLISDGGASIYKHGEIKYNIEKWYDTPLSEEDYELWSNEDLEEYFDKLEGEQNEKLK